MKNLKINQRHVQLSDQYYDDDARKNFEKGRMLATCTPGDEVVISGISGVFPECSDMNQLRESLLAKKDLITGDERRWAHSNYDYFHHHY